MDSNEIKRLMLNLLRKAEVLDVDYERALCRVKTGELESNWMPWIAHTAGDTREWLPPTKGEQVLLLGCEGDPAEGVVLRGFYSDECPAPSNLPSLHVRVYRDGATIQYDTETHTLDVDLPAGATVNVVAPGAVVVKTTDAVIEAETFTVKTQQGLIDGPLTVKGPFAFMSGMTGQAGEGGGRTMRIQGGAEFTDDVKAGNISLTQHLHPDTHGGDVGKPK